MDVKNGANWTHRQTQKMVQKWLKFRHKLGCKMRHKNQCKIPLKKCKSRHKNGSKLNLTIDIKWDEKVDETHASTQDENLDSQKDAKLDATNDAKIGDK